MRCGFSDVNRIYALMEREIMEKELMRISPYSLIVEDALDHLEENLEAGHETVIFVAPAEAFDSVALDRLIRLVPRSNILHLVVCVATSPSAFFSKLSPTTLARLSVASVQASMPVVTLERCFQQLREVELKFSGEMQRLVFPISFHFLSEVCATRL